MTINAEPARTVDGQRAASAVRDATYDLLRAYGLTTIFGNVGSTEETFLENFPADFRYVLGLQEASVVAMADGFAQATRRPAPVNLHTGATKRGQSPTKAWTKDGPTVLEIPISPQI